MNKLKHIMAALLLVLPLAFTGLTSIPSAKAASQDTTYIRLHKLAFSADKPLPELPAGEALSDEQLQGGTPLKGVEFTVYDVTNSYNLLSGDSATRQSKIQKNAVKAAASGYQFGDPKITNVNGTADFALPVKSEHEAGKNAVYLIRETRSMTDEFNDNQSVVKTADPIVLVMPLNQTSTKDNPLHIYPKNQTKKTLTKDLNDLNKLTKITDANNSAVTDAVLGYGDKVSYTVSVVVPTDITSLKQFDITDTPDAGLNINTATIKVVDDQKTSVLDLQSPTLNHDGSFTLHFDPESLAEYAGKTLLITYEATVNQKLVPGNTINNAISLNNQPKVHGTTPITTGGAKFEKTDADTGDGLKGAKFLVTNNDGKQYLTDTGKGYEWKGLPAGFKAENYDPTDLAKNAVILTSEDNGQFEITGLGFGDYSLTEVEAPDGYELLSKPQSFSVNKDSYQESNALKITNTVANNGLPHTGGMGIYIVILVGVAIIGAGIFFLKRSKRHEEI